MTQNDFFQRVMFASLFFGKAANDRMNKNIDLEHLNGIVLTFDDLPRFPDWLNGEKRSVGSPASLRWNLEVARSNFLKVRQLRPRVSLR